MGLPLVVLGFLIPIIGIGFLVYILVILTKSKDKKKVFSSKNLLYSYLYIISFLSLVVGIVSLATTINGWFGQKYPIEFSTNITTPDPYYYDYPLEGKGEEKDPTYTKKCYEGELTVINEQEVCVNKDQAKKDIINGLSIAIPMIILFLIHRLAICYIEKNGTSTENFKKVYNFASLIVFSIGSLIAIPVATYKLLNYLYFRPEDITRIDPPGMLLAFVIVLVPIWLIFLWKTVVMKDHEEK